MRVVKWPVAWRGATFTALLALAALLLTFPVDAGAAPGPQPLWQRCDAAAGDLSCSIPRGIGVSPVSGHLYLADQDNSRIDEYTAWGEFVRAWGWGVSTGAEELQTCTTASSCKAGISGGGKGQLLKPQGVAVDSAGNVYVVDKENKRVQKFDSEGHFIVMFGAKVNKTKVEEGKPAAEQNRCPVDPGDVCQAGIEGVGNGEFGPWVTGSYVATGPSPSNLVYVGDKGRVQVFNPNGAYKEDFPDPEGLIAAGGTVKALAAAPSGGLYLAFAGSFPNAKPNVTRLTSAGKASVSPGCVANVANPTAIAMATNAEGKPTGNLYVFDETHINGEAPPNRIRQFSAACADKEAPFAEGGVSESTGLAAGTTCLTAGADVYLSNSASFESGYVRAYGSAPDKTGLCPKPLFAPQIVSQYATSVGTVEAQLRAQINPRFYADTTYQLQYGTAACVGGGGWEAACVKEQPAAPAALGAEAVDFPFTSAAVNLIGLSPATTYRYRFVAQSIGGGPVFGTEQSFTTFAAPSGGPPCPNEAFRTGPSALLPDCRAYELVSPVDKEGGQILTLEIEGRPTGLEQSASSGDKLTYSSYNSFGDPESSPFTSQYIASREPGGWASHGISPPRGVNFTPAASSSPVAGTKSEFEAFSADLCSGWLVHDNTTAPPLAPGAAPYDANLYRRSDCGAGAGSYVALTRTTEDRGIQGLSADGGKTIFKTFVHLSQEAATAVGSKLNCSTPTPAAGSFQWLREGAPIGGATTATYTATAADEGKAIQCRMSVSGGGAGSVQVANPAWVIAPYPATAPPLAPASIPAPSTSGPLAVGGAAGQTLDCDPGAWQGAEGFSYQWYRNGAAIAGANEATYEVQTADLASPAYLQCEATGENAGGKVAEASEVLASDPAPVAPISRPNMTTSNQVLYELGGEGGPRAVCILPGGTESGGCTAGTETQSSTATVSHALSADGSRVFWTNSPSLEGTIYARIDGKTTVQLSEGPARFWTAAADGSRAIISSAGKLYEIGLADPEAPTTTLIAEGFAGVVGASEDASLLYFASTKALTGEEEDEENSEGATAQAGKPNLYLRRVGAGGETLGFVGTLAAADVPTPNNGVSGLSPVAVDPYGHAARTSADGAHVAFMSRASLTGYDNADAASGAADAEVFLYDAASGQLRCASCNPSGARPSGRIVVTITPLPTAARLTPIQSQLYASHVLSEDGSRLFFESYEPLLLADTNGKADVYEWEEAGTGSCKEGTPAFSALNEGCISLISSGKSPVDSILLDAKPDGRDAFFTTGSSLLPYDPGSIDIYDAREGGGLPAPPAPQPPCEGEACQSPPPPPAEVTPASAAFRGQGNPVPAKHKAHKHKQHKKHKRAHGRRRAGR